MAMGGLSTALSSALAGLNVNQQQLAVLSNNIANANTAGYSDEVLSQEAAYLGGAPAGVNVSDITRQVNQNLIDAAQQQNSVAGSTGVISDYTSRIQILLGQPGSDNSIDTYIGDFFNSMQSLAATPQNSALQQAAVNSGVQVASQVQGLAQGLQNLQFEADGDIGTAVSSVNTDLTNLAEVNLNISNAQALGQSVAGLQDQRDSLLTDLSQYMNIQTYQLSNGMVNVTTSNGISLVDDATPYQLSYTPATSSQVFANNGAMSPILVYRTDGSGNITGQPTQLASGGVASQVTTSLSSGKLAGLLTMRDQQIPDIMSQLDQLASNLRDQVNAVENSGTGYPGANSYTGSRLVSAGDTSQWSGSVQIAVLNSNGQAVASPYADETNGLAPLTLNLSTLNTGNGTGQPSVQGIINAINQYYTPQNKVELGNVNNIQLASDTDSLPGSGNFNFDLNLSNLSATSSNVYVTGVSVTPGSGTNTATVTSPVNLGVSSYQTTANSSQVTINTTSGTTGLSNGQQVYLSGPGTTVDGISAGDLTGFFTITNVTGNSFQITASNNDKAVTGTSTAPVGTATVTPPYTSVAAGTTSGRSNSSGEFSINLGSNDNAAYYNVTLNVTVDDGSGTLKTSQITYQVTNNQTSLLNNLYQPLSATGDGTIVAPTTNQPAAEAILVDANGNELPKDSNGNYTATEGGYLEIKATGSTNVVAINSMNSAQLGQPNNVPPVAGSNQGFSQYFNLNNFFTSNNLTATGDSVAGSAANLQVVQSLQNDPGDISMGTLVQATQPTDPDALPNYTYVRNSGDNSVIQNLASLATATINFPSTGGLGATSQTLGGYSSSIIGAASSNAATATTNQTNAQTLLTGYQQAASKASGVNLDTELANTVIYQNAYSASARVITVTSTLYDALLAAVGTT